MQIVAAIIILSVLVILHELGHLLVALLAKVKVEEFGLGYPPKIWKIFRKWGVDFTLNAIPFGGFVRLYGEDATEASGVKGEFITASLKAKLAIMLAGVATNALVGISLLCIVFISTGVPQKISDARIGYVQPDSPAAKAGLKEYDSIKQILAAGQTIDVNSPAQVRDVVNQHYGENVQLAIQRDCRTQSCSQPLELIDVTLRQKAETGPDKGTLGVAFLEMVYMHYSFPLSVPMALKGSVEQSLLMTQTILSTLKDMMGKLVTKGELASEISGPVGIVHAVGSQQMLSGGWQVVLSFAGALSVNLAIMNILPIPPLDGGKVVLSLLGKFWGKKGKKIDQYLNYFGYFALLGLIIAVTARDIWRIVTNTLPFVK